MAAKLTEVARVQGSAKDPYVISRNDATGELSCTCPGWKFSGAKRGCKHTRSFVGPTMAAAAHASATATGQPVAVPLRHILTPVAPQVLGKPLGPGVMLAHEWDGERDLTGWWLSEKLDGVRARWDSKRRTFVSRKGNVYQAPAFFTEQMPIVDLDGELWLGRGRFNECSGICRRAVKLGDSVRPDQSPWAAIRYVAFDAPDVRGTFEERIEVARKVLAGNPYAMVHQFMQLPSMDALPVMLEAVEKQGGEGLMARRPADGVWSIRTQTLLKIKSFKDAEAEVIGHEDGEGKHEGRMGALRIRLDTGVEAKVGTGFTDKERDDPPPVGARITFRYFELSKDGKPRFPSYVGRRDYE